MKHLIPKMMTAVPVLALALAVGGCGSSSDDDDDMMTGPTPQEECEMDGGRWNADMSCTSPADLAEEERMAREVAQRMEIDAKIADARTKVDAVDNDSSDADVYAAEMAVEAAKTAISMAADVPMNEKDAHTGRVEEIAMRLSDAKMARMMAIDEANEAAAKDAMALFAGIDETASNLTVAVSAVTDEDGDGGMASVTATGLTPGVEGDDVMKSAEPMLGMWQGTMLTDTNADDASTTVVVYTDIEAAESESVPFDDKYTLANDALAIDADADADAHVKLISADDFMHTGRMNHDPDPDATDDVARIRGMFDGASGEYRCTAADATSCASIESSDGVRLVGTWTFDPDSGAMVMQSTPDAAYAYFGWWLNKGTTEGVEAGTFHGITGPTALVSADFTALGGMAVYKGSAAGKYAINPSLSAASGGHWTADATLTADFGSETTEGMISGMVENFMAGGETMNWSVALGETALTSTTGQFDSGANSGSEVEGDDVVWTIGGVAGAEAGAWSGNLHEAGDNNVPTLATGMFSATHGMVGHMVGAFGAHLEE